VSQNLIAELLDLRDGKKDSLGRLLLRAANALGGCGRIRRALEALVEAHDQVPSMLTAEEWKNARAALGRGPIKCRRRSK
jgi:hypothetical protein